MDVQLTKDGVVGRFLYHSSDLSAHTNGKGAVESFYLTGRKLQRLDAAYCFDPHR
ncbi:MAG: Transposase [Candidatus Midichloria mitochondrii]